MIKLKDIFCFRAEETPIESPGEVTDIRTFGRLKSRALSPSQQVLMDERLPLLRIRPDQLHDRNTLFSSQKRDIFLEIGFGNGKHLLQQAAAHPENGYIGAEPFINGVACCVRGITTLPEDNVRIHDGDVRELLRMMPDNMLAGVYILFPDPWPKTRQHKKRLLQGHFLQLLLPKIIAGGRLLIATDHEGYAEHINQVIDLHARVMTRVNAATPMQEPEGWTNTKYQDKGIAEGRPAEFFDMRVH